MTAEEQTPQPQSQPESQPKPGKSKRSKKQLRKRLLTLFILFCLVAGLIYFAYWFFDLRHHEETDNAYVAGNLVQVTSQVSGSVTKIHADNTNLVLQGDILVTLDDTDATQAFERAKTELASTVRQTNQLIINNKQLQANIALQRIAVEQAKKDLVRLEGLGKSGAVAREQLDHGRDLVKSTQAQLDVALQQYNANYAMVLNTPLEQQPAILQASTQVRDTWLALQRTKIASPVTGYISRRSVQVGSYITQNTPLMAVVPADQIWVDANFKETQLASMRIGQPAEVTSDFYGSDVVYKGTVVGLSMGTGSAFSLLPAQNATGNWIKVVQRLPVRIELEKEQIIDRPLRIGLSMQVNVDTGNTEGRVLSDTAANKIIYQTSALNYDMTPVNTLIADIIKANSGSNS